MNDPVRWVTVARAAELTGFNLDFFGEHSRSGLWIEGKVWKWVQGRKVFDLQALYAWFDEQPSIPTRRGRKPNSDKCESNDLQAA